MLASTHFGQTDSVSFAFTVINFICAILFLVTIVLKILGTGKIFFYNTYNIVDLIVVVLSDLLLIIDFLSGDFYSVILILYMSD